MKLISTIEGVWKESTRVQLTEEEKELLHNRTDEVKEARKNLKNRLETEKEKSVSNKIETEATEVYNNYKPELKEGDQYQLISVDMFVDNEQYKGIINCRVNGDYMQIRF